VSVPGASSPGTSPLSGSSSSSSGGRTITPTPAPGAVVTPTAIYHIIDVKAVEGAGHSAVIIPNGRGCTYYSYAGDGRVTVMNFNNIRDALAAAKGARYTHEQHWRVSPYDAASARDAAAAYDRTEYNVATHNCWNMVYDALKAAGTNAENYQQTPNLEFLRNSILADGESEL